MVRSEPGDLSAPALYGYTITWNGTRIKATPKYDLNLPTYISNTDLGVVLKGIDATFAATSVGYGTAFFASPTTSTPIPIVTAVTLVATSLQGTGPGNVKIAFGAVTLAAGITFSNMSNQLSVSGISFTGHSGVSKIISSAPSGSGVFFENVFFVRNSSVTCIYDDVGFWMANVFIGNPGNLEIGGNATNGIYLLGGDSANVTIDSGATGAIINLAGGAVTDNSGNFTNTATITNSVVEANLMSGFFTSYNADAVVGQGLVPIRAKYASGSTAAALTAVGGYTPPAAVGMYRISASVYVTTGTTCSFSVKVNYKDLNGTTHADILQLTAANTAGFVTNNLIVAAGTFYALPVVISIDNSATAITFSTVGTFTTVTYFLNASIERIV